MKKIVKRCVGCIAFVVIATLIWIQVTLAIRPVDPMTIYYEPEQTVDVLMVGSSAWYTFWAPMVSYEACGYASFNYAQGGMPADLMKYCIIETKKHQNPKLVCIDARTFLYREENTMYTGEDGKEYMKDSYVRTVADTMPISLNRMQMLFSINEYLEDPLSNYVDLLFYHEEWKEAMNKGSVERQRDFTKGFDLHTKVTSYDTPADISNITDVMELPEGAVKALRELCSYCQSQSFETVFVALPMALETDEMKMQYNFMKNLCDEYGIAFIDSNDYVGEMGLDYSADFDDETHANYNGTVKFTAWFSLYLMQHYSLPDRRGAEGYEFWQEDLEKWNGLLDVVFPDRVKTGGSES